MERREGAVPIDRATEIEMAEDVAKLWASIPSEKVLYVTCNDGTKMEFVNFSGSGYAMKNDPFEMLKEAAEACGMQFEEVFRSLESFSYDWEVASQLDRMQQEEAEARFVLHNGAMPPGSPRTKRLRKKRRRALGLCTEMFMGKAQ